MGVEEVFVPTRFQIEILSVISLVLALLLPDFSYVSGTVPILYEIIKLRIDITIIATFIIGYLIIWGLLYVFSRIKLAIIHVHHDRRRVVLSLIISTFLAFSGTLVYVTSYNAAVKTLDEMSYFGILILFLLCFLLFFVGIYSLHGVIELSHEHLKQKSKKKINKH